MLRDDDCDKCHVWNWEFKSGEVRGGVGECDVVFFVYGIKCNVIFVIGFLI